MPFVTKIRPGDEVKVAGITIGVLKYGTSGKTHLLIDAAADVKIEVIAKDRGGAEVARA